jgi:hypothetical protein
MQLLVNCREYYAFKKISQGLSSQSKHNRSDVISSCINTLPSRKFMLHGGYDFFSTGRAIGFEDFL